MKDETISEEEMHKRAKEFDRISSRKGSVPDARSGRSSVVFDIQKEAIPHKI